MELYSGPEYLIHFRYSAILVFVGVALVYGTAMPLLYPIALAGFMVLWVNERLLLCYYYRMPPAFDTEITEATLSIMRLLPLLSLPFTFWQLGNR